MKSGKRNNNTLLRRKALAICSPSFVFFETFSEIFRFIVYQFENLSK